MKKGVSEMDGNRVYSHDSPAEHSVTFWSFLRLSRQRFTTIITIVLSITIITVCTLFSDFIIYYKQLKNLV